MAPERRWVYSVVVTTDTADHADQVIQERVFHDEDYGFDYTIDTLDGMDHLYNAAPDLLEAAEVAREWLGSDLVATAEAIALVEAAIAKARGEA